VLTPAGDAGPLSFIRFRCPDRDGGGRGRQPTRATLQDVRRDRCADVPTPSKECT